MGASPLLWLWPTVTPEVVAATSGGTDFRRYVGDPFAHPDDPFADPEPEGSGSGVLRDEGALEDADVRGRVSGGASTWSRGSSPLSAKGRGPRGARRVRSASPARSAGSLGSVSDWEQELDAAVADAAATADRARSIATRNTARPVGAKHARRAARSPVRRASAERGTRLSATSPAGSPVEDEHLGNGHTRVRVRN
jgi:hypothetical protein